MLSAATCSNQLHTMRLKVSQSDKAAHTDVCAALGWSVLNELYTCSDDQTIQKWSLSGEHEGKVCNLGAYVTSLHWFPVASKKQSAGAADLLVVACTDGELTSGSWITGAVKCRCNVATLDDSCCHHVNLTKHIRGHT